MKTSSHALLGSFVLCASSLAFAGCIAPSPESGDEAEVTGEAEGAFTESTCGTASINYDELGTTSWACGTSSTPRTSGSSYGSSSCTNAWIVQFHNTVSGTVGEAGWGGSTLNINSCPNAYVNLRSYDSTGALIQSTNTQGYWNSNLSRCEFRVGGSQNGDLARVSLATTNNSTPRVVAQAYSCSAFLCTYAPVTVWAFKPVC